MASMASRQAGLRTESALSSATTTGAVMPSSALTTRWAIVPAVELPWGMRAQHASTSIGSTRSSAWAR
jgi:hypothetical protein